MAQDGYRSRGRYLEGLRALDSAEQAGCLAQWYVFYRRGALARLRWDHVTAWLWFRRALRETSALSGNNEIPHEYFDLLENYAGWWRNVWWLNPFRFTSWLPSSLVETVQSLTGEGAAEYVDSHPHIKPQVLRVYEAMPSIEKKVPRPHWVEEADQAGRYYQETDSLLGTVDYERSRIARGKIRDCSRLQRLFERSEAIGDLPREPLKPHCSGASRIRQPHSPERR